MIERSSSPREASHGCPSVDDYQRLVDSSPQGSIYACRWWLDAVAPEQNRVLEVRRGGRLAAAWPIVIHGKRDRQVIGMPPLTQKLGVLFAPSDSKYSEVLSSQHELAAELIDQLPERLHFRHRFHENFENWLPFHWRGFSQTTRYTYVIPDLSSADSCWSELRSSCRGDIRKARKSGLRARDDLPLERFLDLHRQTYERQGAIPPVADSAIVRLDAAVQRFAGRKIFAVEDHQGRLHAACWIVWRNRVAYYLLAGSDPEFRHSGAPKLALWEAIQFACSVADTFDFEGSMMPHIEMAFRGFGARQTPYFEIRRDPPPTLRRVAGVAYRAFRGWQRMQWNKLSIGTLAQRRPTQ